MQFLMSAGWYLDHLKQHNHEPRAWDIGYHSLTPMYEGQTSMAKCKVTDGDCYYDGSSLQADEYLEILIKEGTDGLWSALEKRFVQTFPNDK